MDFNLPERGVAQVSDMTSVQPGTDVEAGFWAAHAGAAPYLLGRPDQAKAQVVPALM
jgi:hypothetical protein